MKGAIPLNDVNRKALEALIGYVFTDKDRLDRAITHASARPGKGSNYERLEFLGDRVLGLCVAEMLFRTFREAKAEEDRAALVEAAVSDGRIPPVRRDHWLAALAADEEGMAPVLASLAPGTVPLAEIGHSDDIESAEETLYAKVSAAITTKKESRNG